MMSSHSEDRYILLERTEEVQALVNKIAAGQSFTTEEMHRTFTLLVVALPDALGFCDRLLAKIGELEEEMSWMVPMESA